MIIESAIRKTIIEDSGVKNITTQCHFNYIPQAPTYPLIVLQRVTGSRVHHLGGPSGAARPRFQIESWAETYDAAKSLANLIRVALDGKEHTQDGITFSCLSQAEIDGYEDAVGVHRIIQDYSVRYTE
jgi:hypothetical protein